jgi:hypothetical protein
MNQTEVTLAEFTSYENLVADVAQHYKEKRSAKGGVELITKALENLVIPFSALELMPQFEALRSGTTLQEGEEVLWMIEQARKQKLEKVIEEASSYAQKMDYNKDCPLRLVESKTSFKFVKCAVKKWNAKHPQNPIPLPRDWRQFNSRNPI